jgi:hypothetical protein
MIPQPLSRSPQAARGAALLLALVALAAAGCGAPSTGALRGKVLYDGAPVRGGSVTFHCAGGRSILTGILADGTYAVDNLPPGPARVCVDTRELDPAQRKAYAYEPPAGAKKALPGGGTAPAAAYVAVPLKYADPETTDLTVEVKGGRQTFDLTMK